MRSLLNLGENSTTTICHMFVPVPHNFWLEDSEAIEYILYWTLTSANKLMEILVMFD